MYELVDDFIKMNQARLILELCEKHYDENVVMLNNGNVFAESMREAYDKQKGFIGSIIKFDVKQGAIRLGRFRELCMKQAPIKEEITFQDFAKIDSREGTIINVLEVEKSDKLMKLIVDFGDHARTILAGIKQERENPKEIEGKQALFVVNLPERKMAGEVSQGMLFDIGYED